MVGSQQLRFESRAANEINRIPDEYYFLDKRGGIAATTYDIFYMDYS